VGFRDFHYPGKKIAKCQWRIYVSVAVAVLNKPSCRQLPWFLVQFSQRNILGDSADMHESTCKSFLFSKTNTRHHLCKSIYWSFSFFSPELNITIFLSFLTGVCDKPFVGRSCASIWITCGVALLFFCIKAAKGLLVSRLLEDLFTSYNTGSYDVVTIIILG